MSLESRLKSAVNALEKPFKGIIPENLMPEHSKWEPDQSSEDESSEGPEPGSLDQDPLPTMTINSGDSITFTGMAEAIVEFDTPSHADVVIPASGEITVEGFGLDGGVTVTVAVYGPDESYKRETLTGVTPEE